MCKQELKHSGTTGLAPVGGSGGKRWCSGSDSHGRVAWNHSPVLRPHLSITSHFELHSIAKPPHQVEVHRMDMRDEAVQRLGRCTETSHLLLQCSSSLTELGEMTATCHRMCPCLIKGSGSYHPGYCTSCDVNPPALQVWEHNIACQRCMLI